MNDYFLNYIAFLSFLAIISLFLWGSWCLYEKSKKDKLKIKNRLIRKENKKKKQKELIERDRLAPSKIIITQKDQPLDNDNKSLPDEYNPPVVLLVEDSPTSMLAIKKVLLRYNYKVITADDGLKAWMKIQRSKPDLMISDIDMPNMNGIELLNLIRADLKMMDLPVILITGSVSFHLKASRQANVDGLLSKPFEDNDLIQQVKYILQE